jgi:hypothetical protein
MANTLEVSATQDDWTAVNGTDVSYAALQLKTTGPVLIQVADVKPLAASRDGFMLTKNGLEELPLPNLQTGNMIWVRSFEDEENRVAAYLVT